MYVLKFGLPKHKKDWKPGKYFYWFVRKNKGNGKITSTSEIYTRKENAIKGMKSEIQDFSCGVGKNAPVKVAQGFIDTTQGKKSVFVYF